MVRPQQPSRRGSGNGAGDFSEFSDVDSLAWWGKADSSFAQVQHEDVSIA